MRDELKVRLTPERLIRGAHNVVRRNPSWKGQPLWSLVSELTGYGSTYSIEVCRGIGFDPTHKIGGTLECTAPETAVATEPKFYKLKCHTCEKEFYSAMPASIGVAHCSRECAV